MWTGRLTPQEIEELSARADSGYLTPAGRKPYKGTIDLTGQTFGLLTVLRRLPSSNSATRWLCECECGNFTATLGGNLRSGTSKSCGCIRYKKGAQSHHWKGCGELTGRHWAIIKANAKKRGIDFDLDIQQGWDLYLLQQGRCALTGWALLLQAPVITDITASLDRIDSKAGYVDGNVQWVHKDVNLSKNIHPQEYFIQLCTAVAQRHA